jgi:hypothetical protein
MGPTRVSRIPSWFRDEPAIIEDFQARAGQQPGPFLGQLWSHFKRLVGFLERSVYVLDRLHAVAAELFRSCLEFMLSLLEMPDGRLDPGMVVLGRRTCRRDWRRGGRDCSGGLRRPRLGVKDQG